MPKELSKGYNKYGAFMGRSNTISEPDFPVKMHLVELRFYDYCYDKGGAYWGCGAPMFHAWGDGHHGEQEMFIRAPSRFHARLMVRKAFPNARFYR